MPSDRCLPNTTEIEDGVRPRSPVEADLGSTWSDTAGRDFCMDGLHA